MHYTRLTKAFIAFMVLAATGTVANAIVHGPSWHPHLAVSLLVVAIATSRMKVRIPRINGTMSVNLPFLMLAVITLSPMESILIACVASAVQSLPADGARLTPVRLLFNVSMMAFSSGAAGLIFRYGTRAQWSWFSAQLLLIETTATFFLGQTLPVSIIVSLTDGGNFRRVWTNIAQMTFPYYVVSAGVTSMVESVGRYIGWIAALALLPLMFGIYRSYRAYFAATAQAAHTKTMAAHAGM